MGSWSPAIFANDDALDLLLRLEEAALPVAIRAELVRCFDAYGAFEARRARGENVITYTPEYIEEIIAHYDATQAGMDEFFGRLRQAVGLRIPDDGSQQANAAVASATIGYACVSGDFSLVPEDAHFLAVHRLDGPALLAAGAVQALQQVKLNKPLARSRGKTWTRSVDSLLVKLEPFALS